MKIAFDAIVPNWQSFGLNSLSLVSSAGPAKTMQVVAQVEGPEVAVRRFLARLSLLDLVGGASISCELGEAAWAGNSRWPTHWLGARGEPMFANGQVGLLDRSLVFSSAQHVFDSAISGLGLELTLQLNLAPLHQDTERIKGWARSVVRLEEMAGVPTALLTEQRRTLQAARDASLLVEVRFGAWTEEELFQVQRLLEQYSAIAGTATPGIWKMVGRIQFSASATQVSAAAWAALNRTAAGAASTVEAQQLSTMPVLTRAVPAPPAPQSEAAGDTRRPPLRPQGQFAFISYSHTDAPRVFDVLDHLNAHDVPYWYDGGIRAGDQWDETLEQQLQACCCLIAFVSPRSTQSRYCQRELKYADLLRKPIAPIVIEPSQFEGGLAYLLSTVQTTNVDDPQLLTRIREFVATSAKMAR